MALYGAQDLIPRNRPVQIVFGYSAVLPEFFFDEAETSRLVSTMGVNVRSVDIDSLVPGFRKLIVQFEVDRDVTFGDLGNNMAHTIDAHFMFVFDVMAERYESVESGTGVIPQVPVTTAVSLASIAVVVLIAFILIKRF